MRAAWRKKFIADFEEKARVMLRGYERAGKDRYPHDQNGFLVFFRDSFPNVTLFVVLVISPKRGCFTFEGAWSNDLRFPDLLLPLMPEDFLRSPKGRMSIGEVLPEPNSDHWWWVRNGSKISEALDEGMEAVGKYLLPFLDDVAQGPTAS